MPHRLTTVLSRLIPGVHRRRRILAVAAVLFLIPCSRSIPAATEAPPRGQSTRETVTAIVARIQRADYEGDRPALARLHADLMPFVDDRQIGPRVLYWRGFALWRRALNGFNDAADRREIGEDLTQAVVDFRAAASRDPAFVDAKVGAASCLVNHSFLHLKTDPARARELFAESTAIFNEALAAAPENPRLLWVQGANQWYAPPERGGGQGVAMATYEKGLEVARRQKGRVADPLEPAWGEAELLMNLAFANLNRATPDFAAAERFAQSALAVVPYWHYVRDILLPQIRKSGKAPLSAMVPGDLVRREPEESSGVVVEDVALLRRRQERG